MYYYSVIQDSYDQFQDIYVHDRKFTEVEFAQLVKGNTREQLLDEHGFKELEVECSIYTDKP